MVESILTYDKTIAEIILKDCKYNIDKNTLSLLYNTKMFRKYAHTN